MENYKMKRSGFFNILLPPIVKNLLIINGLFFLADMALGTQGINLTKYLGLHYPSGEDFYWFQYISYMFMHADFSHLFMNMLPLWMFGAALENLWGSKRFFLYYLITGIGAAIIQNIVLGIDLYQIAQQTPELVDFVANKFVTVGASGAVFGILLAFGMLFPNNIVFVFFIPMKAKYFVILYGALELFAGIRGSGDGIAHFAHLGGMLFGLILILYWKKYGSRIGR